MLKSIRGPVVLLAALGAVLALLAAGCPLATEAAGVPATSNTVSSGDSTVATAGASSTSDAAFDASLRQAFPTCDPLVEVEQLREQLLQLVNQARRDAGIEPLVVDETLERQATQYACEMIHYGFFGHVNPVTQTSLSDRAESFGYDYSVIGENLAAGQRSVERAFSDWMSSEGHRANILDERFVEIGIGVRSGGALGVYWVQEFGKPAN